MTDRARSGWDSSFSEFKDAQPRRIRERLVAFIIDASREQIRAWDPERMANRARTKIRKAGWSISVVNLALETPIECDVVEAVADPSLGGTK